MAYVLAEEMRLMAAEFGIEKLGFLTLTFADKVTEIREGQKRFHSLNTGVISKRYRRGIGCWERQKNGRVHFHLVVVLPVDIRTGFDFEAIKRRDYTSASPALRSEWAFWRRTAPKYGFGRTELLPVKSTAEGIARYVGKYVSKHIGQRTEADKGARVVRFLGFKLGDRKVSSRFAWATIGGWVWRHKVKHWCLANGFSDLSQVAEHYGSRWAYLLQETILATPIDSQIDCYPSEAHMARARALEIPMEMAKVQALWSREKEGRPVLTKLLNKHKVYSAKKGKSFRHQPSLNASGGALHARGGPCAAADG